MQRRRGPVMRRILLVSAAAYAAACAVVLTGGAVVPVAQAATATATGTAAGLSARLLAPSNLPPGWHAHAASATRLDLGGTSCLRGLKDAGHRPGRRATATFVQGSGLPALSETLVRGGSTAELDKVLHALSGCRQLTLTIANHQVKARFGPVSLPVAGITAHAFSLALTTSGVPIGADIVLFRSDGIVGELVLVGVGPPTPVTAEAITSAAAAKAQGHAVAPLAAASIAAAPAKVVHTTAGPVEYRELGTGPPLVLIMGYTGTMETWDPRFVDALAHHHEVVVFDNAGLGQTGAVRAPLTIDEMADQTSALISALHLGAPDVLGWSMGSMIAEALAVLHPEQVDRLVLCAAYPGTGTVQPAAAAVKALTSGTPAQALATLFPPDQRTAAAGYELSLTDWPASASAPSGVAAAQGKAITAWWAGTDAAGKQTASISAPTLIADGTEDRLDPEANAHRLEHLIAGAALVLYPDAGHAFLFQDWPTVTARIVAFLGG